MQLVLHSPFGARINRGLGLALRKKFCRTFNFELQAAASDDALVLSLGPHHSFPLDEVPRYINSRTVTDTLEHAVIDSPMFQARWRWNLNRSLMVLRFRSGRRNPPPIQRMESDDLLAAVFPQAAACQENVTGPIDIPDHLLVRQTLEDTLHEALDVDGVKALLERIESGSARVHCRDTVEPSLLAHEIITARPYAFLDDEETQNRRTNAVVLRRGIPTDLSTIGALDPDAIARVQEEIAPLPETADDLHDVLASTVLLRPRPDWEALWWQLVDRGRARVAIGPDGTELWTTTELIGAAADAIAGDDAAVVRVLRGHLELSGVTTSEALTVATTLPADRVEYALAALQQEGFAMQGRYRPGASGAEWVARRLLARIHSYSKRSRRASVEAATAQDFMRFLLRWQHVAPGTLRYGEEGLLGVLEQLQGFEAAAAAWEPELLARRVQRYDPAWLDRLCHAGDVAWLRLGPRSGDRLAGGGRDGDLDEVDSVNDREAAGVATAPSKATPIAVLLRADLGWLLSATREGVAASAGHGPTASVLAVLAERGACFAADLSAGAGLAGVEVERALWDGVARGLVMCDGFAAIRSKVRAAGPTRTAPRPARMSRLRRGATSTTAAAGRWSLVPPAPTELERHDVAEAVAEQLLRRWGVLSRDLALHDGLRLPWREVQWALRRLEDRGLVRGGRFVAGFSGEQYALAEAADELVRVRKAPRSGERVIVNATDPLNLVGVVLPGARVPAVRTNRVVYVDGVQAP